MFARMQGDAAAQAMGDVFANAGIKPKPTLLLHMEGRQIVSHIALDQVPQWAKPVMAAAFDRS